MQIPGYRIEQGIGHGGMATVYRAEQESLKRGQSCSGFQGKSR